MFFNKIKNFVKHKTTFHYPSEYENIFIFSTARSGTTWLAELIATQNDFRIINEPFNIRVDVIRDTLKIYTWNEILEEKNKEKIKNHLYYFINGKDNDLRFNRPKICSSQWKFKTSRIVFKILFAGEDKLNWFNENFKGYFIFLIRHPIPVALSRSVFPRLESFLAPTYSKSFFTENQVNFAKKIIEKGDEFELAILDWSLQNSLSLKKIPNDWLLISYEQMVLEPEKIIKILTDKFELDQPKLMYNQIYKASGSTVKSNKESKDILKNPNKLKERRHWLLEKWKDKVNDSQRSKAFEILSVFNIDYYENDSFLPNNKYWIEC